MKAQGSHAYEDRLLDFVYGELAPSEARQVELHVQDCPRCSEALNDIRGVRTSMSRLAPESAPDAGLDSLLAYAQQSARRAAAGPAPGPTWWRRWLSPVVGVAAVSVFGIVVFQVNREVDLSPSFQKEAKEAPVVARQEADVASAPAAPAPEPEPVAALAASEPTRAQLDELSAGSGGGFPEKKKSWASKRGSPASKPMPTAKRRAASVAALDDLEEQKGRGGLASSSYNQGPPARVQEAAGAPPPPPPPPVAQAPAGYAVTVGETADMPLESRSLDKAEVVQSSRSIRFSAPTPSPLELSRKAEAARRDGDRGQEADLLRAALTAGAQGSQRLDVLVRLCDAELALGNERIALEVCRRVLKEGPGSSQASIAQRYLERALRAVSQEAEAEPVPASAPAQSR